jgi:hypothetical protein
MPPPITSAQLVVAVVQVLRELLDDFRVPHRGEAQAREAARDGPPEIRHSRLRQSG